MPAPVRARHGSAAAAEVGTSAKPALATAATIDPAKNSRGPGMTSGAPTAARPSAATANPSWTATVRSGRSSRPGCQSAVSSGATAALLNHGAIARSVPTPRIAMAAHRRGDSSGPVISAGAGAGIVTRSGLEPLEPLDRQDEDRRAADLDLDRIGHEELTRLHDRRHRV